MTAEQKEKTIFNKEDTRILQQWRRTKQLKPRTYTTYTNVIQHYTRATGLTITELYEEALNEEEQSIPPHRRQIKEHLLDYYDYLDTTNLSENTKHTNIAIIKSFYTSLDITLPQINNNYDTTPDPRNTEKMITRELIQLMLDNAGIRDKAVISFTLMTGQSPNETSHITIDDLIQCWNTELETPLFTVEDIFKHEQEIVTLPAPPMRIKRLKTNNTYWFYLPSETSRYIIEYLHHRQSGKNKKLRIQETTGPLFVTKNGTQIHPHTLGRIFINVGKKCGFDDPTRWNDKTRYLLQREPGTQRVYCAYKYRKYFLNMCRRYAGTRPETDSDYVYQGVELGDFWIGHAHTGSVNHYIQYNEKDVHELQQHYLQMLPYLSLEMEVDVITSKDKKEFLEMKAKYEDMVKEMEELREYVRQKQRVSELAREYGLE